MAVEGLARSGVGELSLFDSDTVALSNLDVYKRQLAQLELLQLVQAGLHGLTAALEVLLLALHLGGSLVEGFLLLVDAALLAGDLGAAVLDFLVRVALELEGFVLRFDDGFLALLLGSLDGLSLIHSL